MNEKSIKSENIDIIFDKLEELSSRMEEIMEDIQDRSIQFKNSKGG